MIQRLQTVFYLLAIIMLAIPLMGLRLVSFSTGSWSQDITLFGNRGTADAIEAELDPLPDLPLYWLNLIVILLVAITIFSFKNLKRQQLLGKVSLLGCLMTFVVFGCAVYNDYQFTRVLKPFVDLGIVLHMTIAAVLFILLGNWRVRKDRNLLDSTNRLR